MANVYDTANQLAADLRQSQQFLDLKKSYDMLKLDAVAYALFKQFQDLQTDLQQKQMQGVEITQEMVQPLQDLGQKMQNIQPIQDLMAKEQALSVMMDDLNQVIAQPIAELYQDKQ
ncbi:YlbF family regulator [Lacticaseibacillus parakribbianus]|uniref:YlbF family regulator n=1 Tax=Lacticaseibacillus parakribbianus TaxID=2970927 RepID=UPI0021CB2884|nr:YlbF family regulator [Lacticaseibacillus parakribbianus]